MDEPPQIHENETLYIYGLANEDGVVRGLSFVNCTIVGPAVLGTSQSHWKGNRTTSRVHDAVYDLVPSHVTIVGAITVLRCSFQGCLFHRIGFATHAEQRARFRGTFEEEMVPPPDGL